MLVDDIEISGHLPTDQSPWPSSASLVDACLKRCSPASEDLVAFLSELGAPVNDLLMTPYAIRGALMGAAKGRAFFHHELRRRIEPADDIEPEIEVWDKQTFCPVWDNGVFHEPKYYSFFQEAPLASYNPNHRRKWRTHELAHGAVGFFWHPEITRFEMYVGARLNELLPVVLWYGLDDVFRMRCATHRSDSGTPLCHRCEELNAPYWLVELDEEIIEHAQRSIEAAINHFSAEIMTCKEEIERGAVLERPRGALNASSDARGYLRSHWNRCTSYHFGRWVEEFMREGIDYKMRLTDFGNHVQTCFSQLLCGPIEIDTESARAARTRRHIQDTAMRFFQCLARLTPAEEDRVVAATAAALGDLRTTADELAQGEPLTEERMTTFLGASEELGTRFSETTDSTHSPCLGRGWFRRAQADPVSLHQVSDGLLSAFGDLCDGTLDEAELNGFVTNPSFWDPLQLPTRYSRWLQSEGRDRSDHFSMRAWCLNEPRRDREAEDFAVVPESPQALLADGTLRLNQTTRRGRFSTDALRELPEFGGTEGKIEIAGWYWHGDLRVLAVDEAMQQILALSEGEFANREDWIITHWDDIAGLCEVGLVIWQPKPK